jgi:peroxiredoxin
MVSYLNENKERIVTILRRKSILVASIVLGISLLTAMAGDIPSVIELGAQAPDFNLMGIDDQMHTLDEYKDAKLLVLVFTCNHCPDALGAVKRLQAFHEEYSKKGVQLVAISGNDPLALEPWEVGWSVHGDSFPEMKIHVKDFGWTFPYLYDGDTQKTISAYGGQSTPHAFLLDAERKVRYHGAFDNAGRNSGPASQNHLRDAVDELLAGKDITVSSTRSRGCSTKWSFKRKTVAAKDAAYKKLPVTMELLDEATAKSLKENKTGKIRVINLWSASCPPCIAELPHFTDAQRRYEGRNVEIITISTDRDDSHEQPEALLKKYHAPVVPALQESLAAEGRKSNNYRIPDKDFEKLADILAPDWAGALPFTMIIDRAGKVVFEHLGAMDGIELRREIIKVINAN